MSENFKKQGLKKQQKEAKKKLVSKISNQPPKLTQIAYPNEKKSKTVVQPQLLQEDAILLAFPEQQGQPYKQASARCQEQIQHLHSGEQVQQSSVVENILNDKYFNCPGAFFNQENDSENQEVQRTFTQAEQQQLLYRHVMTQIANQAQEQTLQQRQAVCRISSRSVDEVQNLDYEDPQFDQNQLDEQQLYMMQLHPNQALLQMPYLHNTNIQQILAWQDIQMRQQMGNQLRVFATKMFKQLNQRQKKKLESKAKTYLEQCYQDHKKIENSKIEINLKQGVAQETLENTAHLDLNQMLDFQFSADPQKYLDEIRGQIKKNPELSSFFDRFTNQVLANDDEQENEQVITDFFIKNPEVRDEYWILSHQYLNFTYDQKRQKVIGDQMFNLIMPYTQVFDPKVVSLIPEATLQQFNIEYHSNGNIRSWTEIKTSDYSNTGTPKNVKDSQNEDSEDELNSQNNPESDATSSEDQDRKASQNIVSCSEEEEGEQEQNSFEGISDENNVYAVDENNNQIGIHNENENDNTNPDLSQNIQQSQQNVRRASNNGLLLSNQFPIPSSKILQSALIGKNKSLKSHLNFAHPNKKNINKHELNSFDNLFKFLKDDKDWQVFCKILFLYLEGVLSYKEFFNLYNEKFQNKLKQEVKEEIQQLLPTRDQSRRLQSILLKAWNDAENQTIEKLPDSSYYRIEEGFPVPICTKKMTNQVYYLNTNDKYLSLATGSENKKFRNDNEQKIYQAEEKMYELDSMIDNIQKSYDIVVFQCEYFEQLSEGEQLNYRLPINQFYPLRFYWDKKFRLNNLEQYFKEGRIFKQKDINELKKAFYNKLEYLKNQKNTEIIILKDVLRKNFTKSLDHKSFQFKDFMKKFIHKQNHFNKIIQISEDNSTKKRSTVNEINILYGSGEQPETSDYKFFNTFGKDFGGKFDLKRIQHLQKTPDYPIDLNFIQQVSPEQRYQNQQKFPQARFLFNNKEALELSLKLIILFIKATGSHPASNSNNAATDKIPQIQILKFIMEEFMMVQNFELIENSSHQIQPVCQRAIEFLMDSALYYQKKYEGELSEITHEFSTQGQIIYINTQGDLQFKSQVIEKSHNQAKSDKQSQLNTHANLVQNLVENLDESIINQNQLSKEQPKCQLLSNYSDGESQNNQFQQSVQNSLILNYLEQGRVVSDAGKNMNRNPDLNESIQNNFFRTIKLKDESEELQYIMRSNYDETSNKYQNEFISQEIKTSIFIPKFINNKNDQNDQKYKLYYGPSNLFMFLMLFYSIYERILKAQELVQSKVEQDFRDDFSKREWSTKFGSKMGLLTTERFYYLIKSILTVMTQNNLLDNNKYEDIARELLGNEAYLLFQIDKIVNQCSKYLSQFNSDNSCRVTQKLFKEFQKKQDKDQNESLYLANFYHIANQQSNGCFNGCKQNQGGHNMKTQGADSSNKEPLMNKNAFRFMYSPKSSIMTVHFINLNPFNYNDVKKRNNYQYSPDESVYNSNLSNLEFLKNFTNKKFDASHGLFENLQNDWQIKQKNCDQKVCTVGQNKVSLNSQPIFLMRNLSKMKDNSYQKFLQKNELSTQNENGLIINLIPHINQMQYGQNTEDSFNVNRIKKILKKRTIPQSFLDADLQISKKTRSLLDQRRIMIDDCETQQLETLEECRIAPPALEEQQEQQTQAKGNEAVQGVFKSRQKLSTISNNDDK